jgi:hypothetical protein
MKKVLVLGGTGAMDVYLQYATRRHLYLFASLGKQKKS